MELQDKCIVNLWLLQEEPEQQWAFQLNSIELCVMQSRNIALHLNECQKAANVLKLPPWS
jgi:hypothetical protein